VLLLPSPGEQHTFGLVMVAEFFRRSGWDVTGGAWAAGADVAALVSAEWFDAVGFSLGAEVHLGALTASIDAVRHATCNRDLKILVGGPLFGVHPEFVGQVGADGMTIDGREAPLLAETLISGATPQHGPPG
jgi:methanogenic corrinoid protein MtbC1